MDKRRVIFTFGRFQPPTYGHMELFKHMGVIARIDPIVVFPSRVCDEKKNDLNNNPLSVEEKIYYLRNSVPPYPDYGSSPALAKWISCLNVPEVTNPFNAVTYLSDTLHFNDITLVVGGDRLIDLQKIKNYINLEDKEKSLNKTQFIHNFQVVGSPDRNFISGTVMRDFVMSGLFQSFVGGLPPNMSVSNAIELYNILGNRLGQESEISLCR